MSFTIPANREFQVAFKINVAGTSSPPSSVRVVVERGDLSLGFTAVAKDDLWTATLAGLDRLFSDGEALMSINVIVNNRIFSPLKKTAMIVAVKSDATDVSVASVTIDAKTEATPVVVPPQIVDELPEAVATPPVEEPALPVEEVAAEAAPVEAVAPPVPPKSTGNLMKMIDPISAGYKPKVTAASVKRILSPVKRPTVKPTPVEPTAVAEQHGSMLRSFEPVGAAPAVRPTAQPKPAPRPQVPFAMKRIKIVTEA